MRNKFTVIAALLLLGAIGAAGAKDAACDGKDYTLRFAYTDPAVPGDPVFVRMTLTGTGGLGNQKAGDTTARLVFTENNAADFYPVPALPSQDGGPARSANTAEFLAAIPLSTWQKTGNFSLAIQYAPFGSGDMQFTLPLTVEAKEFDSETLKMGESNTAIMHDESPERKAQSDKLNKIVLTWNKAGVYQQTPFGKPVASARMTSLFGDRRVYVYTNGKSSASEHYGNDFGVPTGTRVGACADGKVVLAELRVLTGWSVIIEHLPGLYSLYYHMDSITVKEGGRVKQGDKIGASGSTGFATGPHLHWEMRLNAVAVNPDFFTKDFAFCGNP
ncbi:MAG: M23 family metallopeptidase [Treponema sp.]|jgi:murein DD-endopeptidase MepM/ murein hydrolase activator NlpD|nr:M23 family metallopeptidase [Treponema sp.]